MSRWTEWRKLAQGNEWFPDVFDWDGSACYELSISGPRGGGLEIVYIGETNCERRRLSVYGRSGSHLKSLIDSHLKQGFILWYRAQAKNTKAEAVEMQNSRLAQYDYPWNVQRNLKNY